MRKITSIKYALIFGLLQTLIGSAEIFAAETCGEWWRDETRIGRFEPWYNIYFSPINNNKILGEMVLTDTEGSVTHLLENFSRENMKNFLNSNVGKSITWLEQAEFQKFLISIFNFRMDRTHLSAKYSACKKLPRTTDNVATISTLYEINSYLIEKENSWSSDKSFKEITLAIHPSKIIAEDISNYVTEINRALVGIFKLTNLVSEKNPYINSDEVVNFTTKFAAEYCFFKAETINSLFENKKIIQSQDSFSE